ncbi:glycosyltransferase family 2 protein [Cellulomonas sp. URHE0023]|uniref:glycosyltransferase family 2 protein n=1 Tax=Cellulomonas sp. URHE0023 TaxID=1380354 RepID=UPI00048634A2|nr:glycosyltransferase family 2 protein [Cellulomonas sp. URHE0023]
MAQSNEVTISAVLIVKDEEAVLEACLESVQWCDEVVVYDTGSTDGTLEIARRLATTVVEGFWDADFGAARNRALAHATSEWVLILDADEVLDADPATLRRHIGRRGVKRHIVQIRERGVKSDDAITPSIRIFERETHQYVGALHEQVASLTGVGSGMAALDGVTLWHSGYTDAVIERKQKRRRNVEISRAGLDAAVAEGKDAAFIAGCQADLARSLFLDQQIEEALVLAHRVDDEGRADPAVMLQLAASVSRTAGLLEDRDLEDHWLEVWQRNAEGSALPWAARVRAMVTRGDAQGALDALDHIPTTSVDDFGQRFDRSTLVDSEVWAHAQVGAKRRAVRVALEAVAKGVPAWSPVRLMRFVGPDGVRTVLGGVKDADWSGWALRCVVEAAEPEALEFLRVMAQVRPDSLAAPYSAAQLGKRLTLEEATEWSVMLRRLGAPELCPLVAIATDETAEPRPRALAGALAWDVFQEERALEGLQAALALVSAEDEPELLVALDIVAPGLVSSAA